MRLNSQKGAGDKNLSSLFFSSEICIWIIEFHPRQFFWGKTVTAFSFEMIDSSESELISVASWRTGRSFKSSADTMMFLQAWLSGFRDADWRLSDEEFLFLLFYLPDVSSRNILKIKYFCSMVCRVECCWSSDWMVVTMFSVFKWSQLAE